MGLTKYVAAEWDLQLYVAAEWDLQLYVAGEWDLQLYVAGEWDLQLYVAAESCCEIGIMRNVVLKSLYNDEYNKIKRYNK